MAKSVVINVSKRNYFFTNEEGKADTLRPNCERELDSKIAEKLKAVGGNEIKLISTVSESKKSK